MKTPLQFVTALADGYRTGAAEEVIEYWTEHDRLGRPKHDQGCEYMDNIVTALIRRLCAITINNNLNQDDDQERSSLVTALATCNPLRCTGVLRKMPDAQRRLFYWGEKNIWNRRLTKLTYNNDKYTPDDEEGDEQVPAPMPKPDSPAYDPEAHYSSGASETPSYGTVNLGIWSLDE